MAYQQRLQILFHGLLSMKGNDAAKLLTFLEKKYGCLQVFAPLCDPLSGLNSRCTPSGDLIEDLAVPIGGIGDTADYMLALFETLAGYDNHVNGITDFTQSAADLDALRTPVAGVGFDDKDVDVAVTGHPAGRAIYQCLAGSRAPELVEREVVTLVGQPRDCAGL